MTGETYQCTICNTPLGAYSIEIEHYKIFKCSTCGLESTFPIPSDQELRQFYTNYLDHRAAEEVVRLNSERHLTILKKFGLDRKMKVLDFGSGSGVFPDVYGEGCLGYDPFVNSHKDVSSNFKKVQNQQFDAITLWSVLDNQPQPVSTLVKLVPLLKRNGLLAFTVVSNQNEIPYRYKPPEHLTYWTKAAIKHLLNKLNIELLYLEEDIMTQLSNVYINLICSRIPQEYHESFLPVANELPRLVKIPTNELYCIGKKR